VGQYALTPSFDLKEKGIKKIAHVFGPVFTKENEKQCIDQLFNGVLSTLLYCDAMSHVSIAMPAISSGIFGFPLHLCANTIFNAIQAYIDKK